MIRKEKSREGIPELLISGRGGRFRLHYDSHHMLGFVTQIYGDKEFVLFAPSDGQYCTRSTTIRSSLRSSILLQSIWTSSRCLPMRLRTGSS